MKLFYQRSIQFLLSKLSSLQFIMVVATATGLISGLIAVLLRTMVHYLQHWITEIPVSALGYLLFPAIVLLLVNFVIRHFFGGQVEKGIAMVLKSIARQASFIPFNHTSCIYARSVTFFHL
ncbi:MAG: hypothetical protein V4722_01245 [Bacteroidota bacterium]